MSIDKDGTFRNCPSMSLSFGKVEDTKVSAVITNKKFLKYNNINKDKIDVCRDCEFRYVCHDCRAYISDKNNIYSKPSKCGYDPYSSSWNT